MGHDDGATVHTRLFIVLDSVSGTFASYCICWADRTTAVGSYELVGTRSEWRGCSIGREVIYEGLRRLTARRFLYHRKFRERRVQS